jgi:hypothetical protein
VEKDIGEIKDNIKTIMEGLFGSIHEGEPRVGLYEKMRIAEYDIRQLQKERETIKTLNQSMENLNKWKYYIMGGFVVFIAIIDRFIHIITSFFSSR